MGSHDGGVDEQPRQVGLLQGLEDGLPAAVLGPAVEALQDCVGLAEAFGQIGPGSASTSDPEHGIDEEAVVMSVTAGVAGFAGEQRSEAFELFVGEFVAAHGRSVACACRGLRSRAQANAAEPKKDAASMKILFVITA